MKTCFICGIVGIDAKGIWYDGNWFDCQDCLNIYKAFISAA